MVESVLWFDLIQHFDKMDAACTLIVKKLQVTKLFNVHNCFRDVALLVLNYCALHSSDYNLFYINNNDVRLFFLLKLQ